MGVKIEKKAVKATVLIEEKGKPAIELESPFGEVESSDTMGSVGFQLGYTKNLGNYESLKMTVSLYMPCQPNMDDATKTFTEIADWCDKRLEETLASIAEN